MNYRHPTTFERAHIEILYTQRVSIRKIANKIKQAPSTISRELKRNTLLEKYQPETAQKLYHNHRLSCGRVGIWS